MTSGPSTAPGEHNLVLILARGLASSIATPTFLVERDGTVVYFNEPAEALLGQTFAESGEMKLAEWGSTWPRSTGNPVSTSGPESFPWKWRSAIASPSIEPFGSGPRRRGRDIAVTAFPLWARTDEFVGGVAIFWEEKG